MQVTVAVSVKTHTARPDGTLGVGHPDEAFIVQGSPPVGTQGGLNPTTDGNSGLEQGEGAVVADAHDIANAAREHAVAEANRALAAQSLPSQGAQDTLGVLAEAESVADQVKGAVNTWDPLLKRVGQFVELTDAIASVRALVDRSCHLGD